MTDAPTVSIFRGSPKTMLKPEDAALIVTIEVNGTRYQIMAGSIANAEQLLVEARAAITDRITALLERQQELLQTIHNLSQSEPLPAEYEGWFDQRAALTAEVGTMRARIQELERQLAERT